MTILLILVVVVVFIYLLFQNYLNQLIENYLQTTANHHLKPLGVDESAFIGLHKKELQLKNAYMIYARKTTAYKGVILFSPDYQLSYRFYMPLINYLCRQGYILTTYASDHIFYTQSKEDLEALYACIMNDDVLKTYPVSCLGHGSGAYIQLTTSFKDIVSYVSLQPRINELEAMMKPCVKFRDYIYPRLLKLVKKKYHCDLNPSLYDGKNCYIICGQQDDQDFMKHLNNTKILPNLGHYPFLNMDSEQHLKSLECLLAFPKTSQFDYNKSLETFDTKVLYDLNSEVLEILPYLFNDEESKQ